MPINWSAGSSQRVDILSPCCQRTIAYAPQIALVRAHYQRAFRMRPTYKGIRHQLVRGSDRCCTQLPWPAQEWRVVHSDHPILIRWRCDYSLQGLDSSRSGGPLPPYKQAGENRSTENKISVASFQVYTIVRRTCNKQNTV